ncbi:MAG TPA: septal ring lytic transglycosylase RlpA family protein [Candidatus Kapabacteria bacterium]
MRARLFSAGHWRARRSKLVIGILATLGLLVGCSAPKSSMNGREAVQIGIASYYSNDFQGRKTASGEIFDNQKLTAAHRTLPFGTLVRVTNLTNSATIDVRINDRGPVKTERIIDLTYAAARAIGLDRAGLARVRIEVLKWGLTKGA